ncbi:MAG: methylated-DNA--[protein]-cysteine S-methyltransferase [Verrucomicrobiota bacterium]
MKTERHLPVASLPIHTPEGNFVAHYSERGLMQLDFPSPKNPAPGWVDLPGIRPKINRWHRLTTRSLKEVLAGREISQLPPFDLSNGTKFQQTVWAEILKIPIGQTRTYSQLAQKISNPKARRAVGQGCGANPIPLLIPCHRLVAVHGKIGGFSGGLKWKTLLLRREGVLFT